MDLKSIIKRTLLATLVATGPAVEPTVAMAFLAEDQATQGESTKTATVALKITGMTCGGCAVSVRMAAKKVEGVVAVNVSYEKGLADITYDPARTTPEKIAKAVTANSGFKAEVRESSQAPRTRKPPPRSDTRELKVEGLPVRGKTY